MPTLPTLQTLNQTALYDYTITVSPIAEPMVTFMRDWINEHVSPLINMIGLALAPIFLITNPTIEGINSMTYYLIMFAPYPGVFFYAFAIIVTYMPEKVQFLAALILWIDIVFFSYDSWRTGEEHRRGKNKGVLKCGVWMISTRH